MIASVRGLNNDGNEKISLMNFKCLIMAVTELLFTLQIHGREKNINISIELIHHRRAHQCKILPFHH